MVPRVIRLALGVAVGMGVLVGTVWVLTRTLGDKELVYRGRPYNDWLAQAQSSSPGASNEATSVIEGEIVPALVQCMFADTNDSKIHLFLVDELNGLPGVNIHYTPTEGRRSSAIGFLGQLGQHAKGAVPDLIRAIKGTDPVIRPPAARALGDIHCEPDTVIPLLVKLLDDPQDGVPENAADGLGDFGKLSAAAVPKLVELLKVQDKDLRHAVIDALKAIDPAEAAKAGIQVTQ